MAQKARKDLAKSNTTTLNNLHIGTLAINLLFWLTHFLFRRHSSSITLYFLFSLPAAVCEYILETTGRPKYTGATSGAAANTLKSPGEDLSQAGLTEYMFDVVWVTWGSLVAVSLFGNWGWWLWVVVPAYGAVKGWTLLGMARGMATKAQGGDVSEEMLRQQQQGNRKQRRAAA